MGNVSGITEICKNSLPDGDYFVEVPILHLPTFSFLWPYKHAADDR
jgi:hypothetical protein